MRVGHVWPPAPSPIYTLRHYTDFINNNVCQLIILIFILMRSLTVINVNGDDNGERIDHPAQIFITFNNFQVCRSEKW